MRTYFSLCFITVDWFCLLYMVAGNEVHIVVKTDTEYEKKDSNNHFGLKCQVIGYEWSSNPSDVSIPTLTVLRRVVAILSYCVCSIHSISLQCLLLLEKELVSLGAMCAASMLKENTVLPFAGEKRDHSCIVHMAHKCV